jgi:amino acid transporter
MNKKWIIRIAFTVVIALVIFIFFLIARSDGGDWVYAIIMTLIVGEAYLLLPKKWFEKFKKKEKNPLID